MSGPRGAARLGAFLHHTWRVLLGFLHGAVLRPSCRFEKENNDTARLVKRVRRERLLDALHGLNSRRVIPDQWPWPCGQVHVRAMLVKLGKLASLPRPCAANRGSFLTAACLWHFSETDSAEECYESPR